MTAVKTEKSGSIVKVRIEGREIVLYTFRFYSQLCSYLKNQSCNVVQYIKYVILKFAQAGIVRISPLEVYIILKDIERKGVQPVSAIFVELLREMVRELFCRKCDGYITLSRVEEAFTELMDELAIFGKEEVLKRYLPEYWLDTSDLNRCGGSSSNTRSCVDDMCSDSADSSSQRPTK